MDTYEPDFDFDALNPAFTDFESEIPELDMELMDEDEDDDDDDFPEMLEYTDWQEDMYAGEDGFYHNDSGSDW